MSIVITGVQPAEEFILQPAGHPATRQERPATWLEAVFQEHYGRMVGMLARLMGDRAQAEEIASDVFCKLARRGEFRDDAERLAWLYRVAVNAGLDAVRANARRRRRELAAVAERARTAAAAGALDEMLSRERRARVLRRRDAPGRAPRRRWCPPAPDGAAASGR